MNTEYGYLYTPDVYGNQPCNYNKATQSQITAVIGEGGCGPGKIGNWFVPDSFIGLCMIESCRRHDWMYAFGVTGEDKVLSDTVYYNNMLTTIKENPSKFQLINWIRKQMAHKFYLAVKYGGRRSFWKGKDNGPSTTQS